MKKISIVIPTYNEETNVLPIYECILHIFTSRLVQYEYEIIYIDNCSTDATRHILEELTEKDKNVKYIFNAKNFGFTRSTFYGLLQGTGDCNILIFADMQDPPELIATFVDEWEKGHQIVVGIKNKSQESKLLYHVREIYYKFIKTVSEVEHIEQFTGFGLYDKSFVDILKHLHDPLPYLRGIVAELGPNIKKVYYEQRKRERGESSFNFMKLYDVAMLGITSYSKVLLRISTFLGAIVAIVSFIIAIVTFVLKVFSIIEYPIGTAAMIIGIFFLGAVQLFFIGLLGEYIVNINIRTMDRPLVIEERRKNFDIT